MKNIGRVNGISRRGDLILQGGEMVPDGTPISDPRGREIGKVMRVIGPVSDPYVIVRPKVGVDGRLLTGIEMHANERKRKWSKRRGKQRR